MRIWKIWCELPNTSNDPGEKRSGIRVFGWLGRENLVLEVSTHRVEDGPEEIAGEL